VLFTGVSLLGPDKPPSASILAPLAVVPAAQMRIPLIVDTRSRLIADSVPGDRGHPLQVS